MVPVKECLILQTGKRNSQTKTAGKLPTKLTRKLRVNDLIEELEKRSDEIWGAKEDRTQISNLLGSSADDPAGLIAWKRLARTAFIAPNFYLELEKPKLFKKLSCIEVGSDRDDRPLYYFLKSGYYALSTNKGLLYVAKSSLNLFSLFLTYGEWVEEINSQHGNDTFTEGYFSEADVKELGVRLSSLLSKENFSNSFWREETLRLSKGVN